MKQHFVIAAGLMASTGLYGQTALSTGAAFQYFSGGSVTAGPSGAVYGFRAGGIEGVGGNIIAGKPLSATEERHTLQVLGDGTRIENTETNQYFRDDLGRTRTERPSGSVMIQNPVDGFMAELDANTKTVHKMSFRVSGNNMSLTLGAADLAKTKAIMAKQTAEFAATAGGAATGGGVGVVQMGGPGTVFVRVLERHAATEPAPDEESLGMQSVNGVTAQGTRTTMTIATGQIGNDRPIQVVSERWFSTDLQMLVKSGNSDPRFGETTYNLTNINQAAPDPSLFQIPGDYKSDEGAAGR